MYTPSYFSIAAAILFLPMVAPSAEEGTYRASLTTQSSQAKGPSGGSAIGVSVRGKLISFASDASNLVAGDTNGLSDAFVRDRGNGAGVETRRVSIGMNGAQPNGSITNDRTVLISADGRIVAFGSNATNLVGKDTNGVADIFAFDQIARKTERVSIGTAGTQANRGAASRVLGVSADGRYVLFRSDASNLVAADTNGAVDVFVRDRKGGLTQRLNVSSSEAQANDGGATLGGISGDGRYVVFSSTATNLTSDDQKADEDVFVRDRQLGTTRLISRGFSGAAEPAVSGDGRFVAFRARKGGHFNVYLNERATGATVIVSQGLGGAAGNGDSGLPALSRDGRFITYMSAASNLVAKDTNGVRDVFAWDRLTHRTKRVSLSDAGAQSNGPSTAPAISPSAEYIAFVSDATNLGVAPDTNGAADVYVRYPELDEH